MTTALRRRALACAAAVCAGWWGAGCAGGVLGSGMGEPIQFRAPSPPDPDLAPMMDDVKTIGVLSTTNIEPVQGLDIEKVMGRLTDATARGLGNLPNRTVISQDEIRWHFRDVALDSAAVFGDSLGAALRGELELDALVFITLRSLNAQMTPVSPSPYGAVASPGLNLSVELELLFVNLHSGQRWSQAGRRTSWEPVQVDAMGGGRGDPTERQMLGALAAPLRQFLMRVAPPPRRQVRQFDTSGD